MIQRSITLAVIAFTLSFDANATPPTLAAPFGDNMILQRDMNVPVWGTAEPGAQIQVTFAGQTQSTKTDAQGKWMLKLTPMPGHQCRQQREPADERLPNSRRTPYTSTNTDTMTTVPPAH